MTESVYKGIVPLYEYSIGDYQYSLWPNIKNGRLIFSLSEHKYVMDVVHIRRRHWLFFWNRRKIEIVATFYIKLK